MTNYFKRYERKALVCLLIGTFVTGALGVCYLALRWPNAGKLLATSGLLSTISGVVQLEVSGFFAKIIEQYVDVEKHPYGPPSYVTREIIMSPDAPFREWIRGLLHFRASTGFWLIVVGGGLQLVAVWA